MKFYGIRIRYSYTYGFPLPRQSYGWHFLVDNGAEKSLKVSTIYLTHPHQ